MKAPALHFHAAACDAIRQGFVLEMSLEEILDGYAPDRPVDLDSNS
jgi:hypothetical protein